MKIKTILFSASLLLFSGIILKAQSLYEENFYYYKGGKVPLKLSAKKIVIGFKSNISFKEKKYVFDKIKVIKSPKNQNSVIKNTGILHIQLIDELSVEQVKQALSQLEAFSAVCFANPYFYSEEGIHLTCTDKIIVELRKDTDYNRFEDLVRKMGIIIREKYRFADNTYILQVSDPASLNTLKVANQLFESGYFVFAEPDFQGDVQEGTVPNDFYYTEYQWGLNNTGQYNGTAGIDINMQAAWDITTGCPSIRVAVIDNGIDLGHPDLQANMDPGYDAIQDQPGGGYIADDDDHGTPCAGIIAATANNNEGVAGIAHFCRILPVRAYSSLVNGSTSFFVRAIDWAWKNGADVISNSYGWTKSDAFDKAIERATAQGRNGLGCIFTASSMNDDINKVSYPALHPSAIAVGAVNMCGERKSKTSCDGDTTWGGNYGEALDVMAPSTLIITTDIYGSGGYNIADYCLFSGTSAACPHVAGVAALVLSVNPTLKASEVKNIIESTCKKLPNYTYTAQQGYANGTRNEETGYGMVDAFEAVKKAGTVYIQNKSMSASIYRGVFIHAGSNVTQTLPQGPVTTAENTATGYLVAQSSIFLKPGVHIKQGSKFSATIDTTMYMNQCVAQNLPPVPVINPNPPNDLITLSDKQSDAKAVSERESSISEVFSVYPNPFGDELNLHFETEGGAVSFVLRDAAGRSFMLLENKTFARGRHTLRPDISHLPAGVYVYTFSEGERSRSGKLLKNR